MQTISFVGNNALHLGFGSLFGNTVLTAVNLGRANVTFDALVFNNDIALNVVYCIRAHFEKFTIDPILAPILYIALLQIEQKWHSFVQLQP